jgi:hypothetical protein
MCRQPVAVEEQPAAAGNKNSCRIYPDNDRMNSPEQQGHGRCQEKDKKMSAPLKFEMSAA